jgi:hypothetical protein
MSAQHLFLRLTLYYAVVITLALGFGVLWPGFVDLLPVGGARGLLGEQTVGSIEKLAVASRRVETLQASMLWLLCAVGGALATVLPVTWTYIACRDRKSYDQALVESLVIMPIAVTAIVLMVQNSLAMAFSLAGIVGAIRFRNSLKNTGDALFLLVAIAVGLSAGIGALEVAFVMTIVFNYVVLLLWVSDYGGIQGRRRYLRESHEEEAEAPEAEAEEEAVGEPDQPTKSEA